MILDKLKQFRQGVYTILGNAKDVLFDLMDAVLVTRSVKSFVELSLSPVFRRRWSSIYEGLEDSKPPRKELMQLYTKQIPHTEEIVLAGDHTAWSRLEAVTLKERTYEHQAQPMSGAKPVTTFEFKIQNSKFKTKSRINFELINFGYRPPPQSPIWWSSISGGFKPPLIVILNFEF